MKVGKLGATVQDGGVTFGVWAPFAGAVAVMGDFNDWSPDTTPLQQQPGGQWQVFVPNAQPGQEYKFVIKNGDQLLYRNDPRALQLTAAGENSIIIDDTVFDWEGDSFTPPAPQDAIIYELHIGTFARDNPDLSGTLNAAITKLDHLKNLGVNVIELMPCSESKNDVWWGYTPDFIYAVDAAYGGRHAFKAFVKAAHQHGIAVILDVVYNHIDARDDIDMVRFDGWSQDGGKGIYFYNDYRAKTPWGDTRLDYGRPEVRQYIVDNAVMWVQDCHVDGLRVDSAVHIRRTTYMENGGEDIPDGWRVLTEMTQAVKKIKPNCLLIAEDLQGNSAVTTPVSQGGAGFDAQWEPWLGIAMREVADVLDDHNRDPAKIAEAITANPYGDPFKKVVFTESHDLDANGGARLNETIAPGAADSIFARRRSLLGAAVMLTAPGIPMLFQGQEFLEVGAFNHWHPLDWRKTTAYHGILQLYTDLIHLRRNTANITQGLRGPNIAVLHNDPQTKVLAYHRWDKGGPGDDVVVVLNFMDQTRTDYSLLLPRAGVWKVRLNSDWNGYGADFGNTNTPHVVAGDDKNGKVNIGPYSAVILSQD